MHLRACFRLALLSAFALSAFPGILSCAEKRLRLSHTSGTIAIDGVIDSAWAQADSVSDFFQMQPYHAQPPMYRTTAKVLTTDDALHCLVMCECPRDKIRNESGLHDQSKGDHAVIMLDTFDDKRTSYMFLVTAGGVTSDARMLDDGRNVDDTWDGVWAGASRVYDWGYVAEMKIPFRSLRYDPALTEWGLDFSRWVESAKEEVHWCAYERNEGMRISKYGRLVFDQYRPTATGLNLEVYPVGLLRATYLRDANYKVRPDAGLDISYNPSERLTLQMTANPDFAQIEADPFEFNISRYETYYGERRPFFTEGSEVFLASGRQHNSGFYRPMELFYSRRIGKLLPDGTEVPLLFGTKAFGRMSDWEYGGFLAVTGETGFTDGDEQRTEPQAWFAAARAKKQIFENSSVGLLVVGKRTASETNGVIDIDGAFRTSEMQLSYQLARSVKNSGTGLLRKLEGDFAGSAGMLWFTKKWTSGVRLRAVGKNFDVSQVGYVPWKGTVEGVALTGPIWYFNEGYISEMLLYGGAGISYEDVDAYTDWVALLGFDMEFRPQWGYEVTFSGGKSRDAGKQYTSYEADLSMFFSVSPSWDASLNAGYLRTYNFNRDYTAFYSWVEPYIQWRALNILDLGTSAGIFIEGNPSGKVEDVTFNTRPYFSLTPVNNLNLRVYFDNVFVRSTEKLERTIIGVLFSYNFLSKSWIYIAFNELRARPEAIDAAGNPQARPLRVTDRLGVLKIKYLYYL